MNDHCQDPDLGVLECPSVCFLLLFPLFAWTALVSDCAVCSEGYGRGVANECHICTAEFEAGMYFVLSIAIVVTLAFGTLLAIYLVGTCTPQDIWVWKLIFEYSSCEVQRQSPQHSAMFRVVLFRNVGEALLLSSSSPCTSSLCSVDGYRGAPFYC